ncbi:MAG TPA: hypothetical protein VMJ32_08970 [Pirellulales bacterium]|nr:hypothetical protein [Pirellulales bacterium]
MNFRWIEWNLEKVAKHGVTPDEAERIIETARRPYPTLLTDDRWFAIGRGSGGRLIQVAFLLDEDGTVFVIHARPLTEKEKRRFRRRTK